LEALVSRESSFLFNNLILVGIAFAVFWGTIFPIISEAIRGVKITVGPPYYNQVNIPLGIILLALTGICPLIAWRKASKRNLRRSFIIPLSGGLLTAIFLLLVGLRSVYSIMSFSFSVFVLATIVLEFYRGGIARSRIGKVNFIQGLWDLTMRNKQRYGGYIVHLGIIMIFVGITGSSAFQKEKVAVLDRGESLKIGDYTLSYQRLVDQSTEHAQIIAAELKVNKAGKMISTMFPSKQIYKNQDPVSEVDIRQTPIEDLYIILSGWDEQQRITIKVLVIPLVWWIWTGGMVMIVGTLIAIGPDRVKRKISRTLHVRSVLHSKEEEAQYA
jgi:cytochrome c-type biogenesis protein CcmF